MSISPDMLALSEQGDRVFRAMSNELVQASRWRLLAEQRLDSQRFAAIRSAMLAYVSVCVGSPAPLSEAQALERLLVQRADLINYTRGGMLAPTREHTLEFNLLHRSVASALKDYALGPHISGIDLPINVRLVYGEVDQARQSAAFSSTKLHSDVWAGIPPDAAVVVLPVLGDIDNITIECFEMDRAQEFGAMRALRDYDDGSHVQPVVAYDEGSMKHGHLYVADARLLHKTVRRKPAGVRLSIDFRFRYDDPEYRAALPAIERGGPDSIDSRVPYEQWCEVGSERLIVFDDTLEDLRQRKGVGNSSPVNAAAYRLLPLARAGK
jgi:hypothetical protein